MAHFQNITLSEVDTPEQLQALTRQYEHQQRQNGQAYKPAGARSEIVGGTIEIIAGRDGTLHDKGKTKTAFANPGLRPGHVIVGGIETTIDVALREGLISPEEAANAGFKGPVAHKTPTTTGTKQGTPKNSPQEATSAQQDVAEGDTLEDGQVSPEAAAQAASEALQSIERAFGPEVVDMGLDEVAESGYLPEEDQLPQGVTADHLETVVAGYVAQANDALSGVGASVDMLMETMTDDELREARRATLMGDSAKLQHLGQQSVARLATLPSADPEAFADMIADMRPNERKALSQTENGEWIVTVPGKPAMSFGAAVRAGIVRL